MEKSILSLIVEAEKYLAEQDFSAGRQQVYSRLWRLHFLPYMVERKQSAYSPDVGQEYVMHRQSMADGGLIAKSAVLETIRAIQILDDILLHGEIKSHRKKSLPPLTGAIGDAMNDFLDYLRAERRSALTIEGHHRFLLYFLTYLTNNGIGTINDITPTIVLDYLSGDIVSKKHTIGTLRYIFKYWGMEGLIGRDIINVFNLAKPQETEKLPDTYSVDEIKQILASVDRRSPQGIRNYAMLTLAVFYGIRASDIAELRLEHIDWRAKRIEFKQVKTGEPLSLPLRVEVGNAILDYIKEARRNQSKDSHVFQALVAPFAPVTNKCVSTTIRIIIAKSGVDIKQRRQGPHVLRSSLASNMLNNNEEYYVISETLGHVYTPTTMKYLRIDIPSMMKCALDVPPVADTFYTQKGGIFYES